MFTLHCYPNQISTVHSMVLSGWLRKVGGVGGGGEGIRVERVGGEERRKGWGGGIGGQCREWWQK